MSVTESILAIDQGTSGTKAIVISKQGEVICRGYRELRSIFPKPGYVEQDPEEIYLNVLGAVEDCVKVMVASGRSPKDITTCGISNQRETLVLWNREGKPLYNAIVWQCKRSINICEELQENGYNDTIHQRTGLIIDPYFSGTKVIWAYRNIEQVKNEIDSGNCFFGTVDTWILYKLTNGQSYFTDYTNASRTLFFNINTLEWDNDLLSSFGLENLQLPQVKASGDFFGKTDFRGFLDIPVPVNGMIGDSHAAAFGEQVFEKGMAKITLGTGSSILWNTGNSPVFSDNGLVTTICWSTKKRVDYALEGVIVSCGSIIEWLKNQLGLFAESAETEEMATAAKDNGGVIVVPAFSGMGAPYWKMDAKAAITGLTFGTSKEHIVRASLETIAFQIKDIITMMESDSSGQLLQLHANGGLTKNNFLMKMLGNLIGGRVACSSFPDISALGAALIAGLGAEIFTDIADIEKIPIEKLQYVPEDQETIGRTVREYEEWKKQIINYLKCI